MANRGALTGVLQNSAPGAKKANPKPKTRKHGTHKVTGGEKSATNHGQQHGEMESFKRPTERQLEKDGARSSMRRATMDWVDGRISSKQHKEVHARAASVLAGKHKTRFGSL